MHLTQLHHNPLSVLRIEHDDGGIENYAFTHGGDVVVCADDAAVTALAETSAQQQRDGDLITGWPGIRETLQVGPRCVFVKVVAIMSWSSRNSWYMLGEGASRRVGSADDNDRKGSGWCPDRLDRLIAVSPGMRRAAIVQRRDGLGILDLRTERVASMNVPARPAHDLALARERPLVAICDPGGSVQVRSTENGKVVLRRDLTGQQPRRPRFDEREGALVVDTDGGVLELALDDGP